VVEDLLCIAAIEQKIQNLNQFFCFSSSTAPPPGVLGISDSQAFLGSVFLGCVFLGGTLAPEFALTPGFNFCFLGSA
jgi:hypothetical protein